MPVSKIPAADDEYYATSMVRSRQCIKEGRLTQAIEHARHAIGLDPSRPEAFNLLGVCCEARHARLEAQKYYQAALAFDPSFAPALRNLHRLVSFHKQGRVDLGER